MLKNLPEFQEIITNIEAAFEDARAIRRDMLDLTAAQSRQNRQEKLDEANARARAGVKAMKALVERTNEEYIAEENAGDTPEGE